MVTSSVCSSCLAKPWPNHVGRPHIFSLEQVHPLRCHIIALLLALCFGQEFQLREHGPKLYSEPCPTLSKDSISSHHSQGTRTESCSVRLPLHCFYNFHRFLANTLILSSGIRACLQIMPVCKFFSSKSGCARGDQCYYQHGLPPVNPADRAQSWRKTRNESDQIIPAGASLANFPDPVAKVSCRYYSIGACKNGDSCRFRHEGTRGETSASAVPQHGGNGQLTDEQQDSRATDGTSPFPSCGPTNIKPTGHPTAVAPGLVDPLAQVRCRYFILGTCRNGDNCRFQHEVRREGEPEQEFLPLQAGIGP